MSMPLHGVCPISRLLFPGVLNNLFEDICVEEGQLKKGPALGGERGDEERMYLQLFNALTNAVTLMRIVSRLV